MVQRSVKLETVASPRKVPGIRRVEGRGREALLPRASCVPCVFGSECTTPFGASTLAGWLVSRAPAESQARQLTGRWNHQPAREELWPHGASEKHVASYSQSCHEKEQVHLGQWQGPDGGEGGSLKTALSEKPWRPGPSQSDEGDV